MQRLDYHVLTPYLQPKREYVRSINMTELQKRFYKFYLDNYAKAGQVLFNQFSILTGFPSLHHESVDFDVYLPFRYFRTYLLYIF